MTWSPCLMFGTIVTSRCGASILEMVFLRTEQRLEIACGVWRFTALVLVRDEEALVRHANSREIWLNLRDQFPHPYTAADAEAWIKFASAQLPPRVSQSKWVRRSAVLVCRLHGDVERVLAELGDWLGEAFWNRGIMSAAIPAFTRYVFQQFCCRVFPPLDHYRIERLLTGWSTAPAPTLMRRRNQGRG